MTKINIVCTGCLGSHGSPSKCVSFAPTGVEKHDIQHDQEHSCHHNIHKHRLLSWILSDLFWNGTDYTLFSKKYFDVYYYM